MDDSVCAKHPGTDVVNHKLTYLCWVLYYVRKVYSLAWPLDETMLLLWILSWLNVILISQLVQISSCLIHGTWVWPPLMMLDHPVLSCIRHGLPRPFKAVFDGCKRTNKSFSLLFPRIIFHKALVKISHFKASSKAGPLIIIMSELADWVL